MRAIYKFISLNAFATFILPLYAVFLNKMITMPRKSPTIMESPHDRNVGSAKIFKQDLIVKKVIMNVM